MKKLSLSLVLVFSLQGAPLPAHASNGMNDMMSTMMQMFLWMMSGGSGGGMSGFSPYAMNPYSMNPSSLGGLGGQGFPLQGSGFPGYYGGLGGSPYSQYGYGGRSPYYDPYTRYDPYNSRYSNDRNGYADPYSPPYNQHRPDYPRQEKTQPVVIQPIIVSPGQQSDGTQTAKVEVLPVQTIEPVSSADKAPYAAVPAPPINSRNSHNYDNPLRGRWQGVNGEFLQLGSDSFRLRAQDSDLRGTYQLKNDIMKIAIINRTEPVYMQYRLSEGKLVFRSEDGQMMLFRRMR
ncbi:MAG: hypothetical protein GWO88_01600 [Planctomycetia bacterium]|nr:hypothetical protein [Planctomycetia bacterium]